MTVLETDIETALKAAIDAAGLGWSISWQNIDFDGKKPYIAVQIVRVNRRDDTLNGENTISLGRVIGTIVVAKGSSTRTANRKADQFAGIFPMGRTIAVPGGQIVFTKPADIQEGLPQDADWRVPVVAQYEAS